MNENFLRFKERQNKLRLMSSLMIGGAVGLAIGGLVLILSKLDVLGFAPIFSLLIGALAFGAAFAVAFYLGRRTDYELARRLDSQFALKEKVRTMVDFGDEEGDMILLQRQDAERSLSEISDGEYRIDRIWRYFLALGVAAAVLVAGLCVPNIWKKHQNPPFALSEFQLKGLSELIDHVDGSEMEEQYRTAVVGELRGLLEELGAVDNERDMRAALAESMAFICDITYRSSSSAEVLDALWASNDKYLRYMAKWLDTSAWTAPDEGDFADKLVEYLHILLGDGEVDEDGEPLSDEQRKANLSWVLEGVCRKAEIAITPLGAEDRFVNVLRGMILENDGSLAQIYGNLSSLDFAQASAAVTDLLYGIYGDMYGVLKTMRNNAIVGEYTMTRLASLFGVPLPEFERPGFVKTGESVEGNQGQGGEDDDPSGNHQGGIGEGSTFGSDDLVLDPLTGTYRKYGEIINDYYGKMTEKIESGLYTDEQIEAIMKYFELLHSGIQEK